VLNVDEIEAIGARHGLGLVVVFGSGARGTARPESDLDVGVLRADGRPLTHAEHSAILWELGGAATRAVDLADLATDDAIFRREVARDGRVVYADDPERWIDFVARTLIDYADIGEHVAACVEAVERAAAGR